MEKNKNSSPESDVYVRICHPEAVAAKKNLLEINASIINMQMLSDRVRRGGKIEVRQRNDARSAMRSMNAVIGSLVKDLPKLKIESAQEHKHSESQSSHHQLHSNKKVINKIRQKNASLNQELLEIKRKLESLKA